MARRGRNEGSIFKRKDGRYEARMTLPDGRRQSFYGKNRKEVAERLRDALADQAKGLTIAPEKLTVAQYLQERWLPDVRLQVDVSSYLQYEAHVRRYIIPALGKIVLARLSAPDVQKLYTDMAEQYAAGTIHLTHATLYNALEHACNLGLVQHNASKRTRRAREEKREPEPFTEEQAKQLLAATREDIDGALIALALTTGMRQGELLGLRRQDLRLAQAELTVNTALQHVGQTERRKRDYHLAAPKTSRSQRKIALSRTIALPALHAHLEQQAARAASSLTFRDQGLVFPNEWGDIRTPGSLYGRFKRILKRAGLPDRRFHDLRHTAATLLLLRGVNIKLVSEMLGHSDIAFTLRIYGHLLPHTHEQAAVVMDEIFGTAASSGQNLPSNAE